jgi:hypothetical protein
MGTPGKYPDPEEETMRLTEVTQQRSVITEGKVVHNDGHLVVIENPSRTEAMNLIQQSLDKELRGFLDGSSLFVWDAYLATHDEVSRHLDIDDPDGAYQIELLPDHVRYDFVLMDTVGYEPDDDDEEGIAEISAVSHEQRDEIARHPMLVRIYGPNVRVDVSWY